MRPLGLFAVLIARCLGEGPGQAASTRRLWLFVFGRKCRRVDTSKLVGKVRVLFEKPLQLGRLVENAKRMRGAFAGLFVLGPGFWFGRLGKVGWVVLFMRAEADDGAA